MKKQISSVIYISSIFLYSIFSTIVALPARVFGQNVPGPSSGLLDSNSTLSSVITNIIKIFGQIVPLLIGAAIVVFLWGIVLFIARSSSGDAEGRKEGINFMIFGIIGIAVMVSVWGLVAFVTNTLGTCSGPGCVPQFNSGSDQSGGSKNLGGPF